MPKLIRKVLWVHKTQSFIWPCYNNSLAHSASIRVGVLVLWSGESGRLLTPNNFHRAVSAWHIMVMRRQIVWWNCQSIRWRGKSAGWVGGGWLSEPLGPVTNSELQSKGWTRGWDAVWDSGIGGVRGQQTSSVIEVCEVLVFLQACIFSLFTFLVSAEHVPASTPVPSAAGRGLSWRQKPHITSQRKPTKTTYCTCESCKTGNTESGLCSVQGHDTGKHINETML